MIKERRHINIPVFIPHLGCPNSCVFCNQRTISGTQEFRRESVIGIIDKALSTVPEDAETQIAFFGGSFTGIDRDLMIHLLDLAKSYVESGRVSGIRLSTRPDYINDEILDILCRYPVDTVELGIQSVDDDVLIRSRRGHTAADSVKACRMVKERGFKLIGQMMIGLPGATGRTETECAEMICSLGADGARVYPTVIFRDTELCHMAESGEYREICLEEYVERTKNVLRVFASHRIPVIRVGLCASENLADESMVYGGASQPAIGEMAMSELYFEKIKRELTCAGVSDGRVVIEVPRGEISKAVGQKKKNIEKLKALLPICDIKFVENDALDSYCVRFSRYDRVKRRTDNCT